MDVQAEPGRAPGPVRIEPAKPVFDIRRRKVLRQVWLSVLDYVLNILLLLLFAWLGVVPYSVPLTIFCYAAIANTIYLGLIYSGLSQHFQDPFLTRFGVGLAVAANFLGLLIAPQIAFLFIINLFVPLGFAALRFTRLEFLLIGLFYSVGLGVLFALGLVDVPATPLGPGGTFLGWVVITLVITRFLVIQTEIARLANKLREKNEALQGASAQLAYQVRSDELTGLTNRREFMRLLQQEMKQALHGRSVFCVVMLDVDHFKQVNDRYGHMTGDQVLVMLTRLFLQVVRDSDVCARYGGEEFTLLVHTDDLASVHNMVERLRARIERHDWCSIAPDLRVTVSAGIARWREGQSQDDLLRRADDAMYEAKNSGRNRVCVAAG